MEAICKAMRPVNFKPVKIIFSSSDNLSVVKYPTNGILFQEGVNTKFIVTDLLYEKIAYSLNSGDKWCRVTIGTILKLTDEISHTDIVMNEKKFNYWKGFLKMRRL